MARRRHKFGNRLRGRLTVTLEKGKKTKTRCFIHPIYLLSLFLVITGCETGSKPEPSSSSGSGLPLEMKTTRNGSTIIQTFIYNDANQVISIVDGNGGVDQYTYNAQGLIATSFSVGADQPKFEYEYSGDILVKAINPGRNPENDIESEVTFVNNTYIFGPWTVQLDNELTIINAESHTENFRVLENIRYSENTGVFSELKFQPLWAVNVPRLLNTYFFAHKEVLGFDLFKVPTTEFKRYICTTERDASGRIIKVVATCEDCDESDTILYEFFYEL